MVKILGTGLSGLVGSRIVELLSDIYEFENLSLKTGVDITKFDQVLKRFAGFPSSIVLHLAAKTDVDSCEKDKFLRENGDAWKVNVLGTRNIVEAAKKTGRKIIYVSTDFVFDGTPKNAYLASRSTSSSAGSASTGQAADFYTEEDTPNPINWYGMTKYEGEKIVKESGLPFLICRIAYPYRGKFIPKKDFFRSILEKLKDGQKAFSLTDYIFTPTFIDDIAHALKLLIEKQVLGIYHLVGSQSLTPFEAANLIAEEFNFEKKLINSVKMGEYYKGRAPRPLKLALKNDKIKNLGVKMSTFKEGLQKIKKYLIPNT